MTTTFPDPRAIDAELAAVDPLPVLYCHGCSDETHDFHKRLARVFEEHGLWLQRDPFEGGDDVQVAMRRLNVHGVLFHADAKSIASTACALELETARTLGIAVLTLCDGVSTPSEQRNRISIKLPARASITPRSAENLARQMRERAWIHWVLEWIAETGRAVEEREAGAAWLCEQAGQVLAEFLPSIARLHRGEQEDPTVAERLAAVLERTNLRPEARRHLLKWYQQATHPLPRIVIQEILERWGSKVGEPGENPVARRYHPLGFRAVVPTLTALVVLLVTVLASRGCHYESDGHRTIFHIGAWTNAVDVLIGVNGGTARQNGM